MATKPTYEELERRVQALQEEVLKRKQAEKALRESEEKYRLFVETANEGVWAMDAEHQTTFINQRMAEILGYTIQEMLGKPVEAFMFVEDLRDHDAKMEKRKQGHDSVYERRFRSNDGREVWTQVSATPILGSDGHFAGSHALFTDITESKRAEEELRQSENKLRATLDATPFPIAVVDLRDDNIFYWSQSALELFGHTAPTAPEWYQIAYPDPDYRHEVIERWKPFLEIARESGQPVNTGEYEVTCKDGSVRICELYATFLPDSLIVTFNDITERKRAEDALHKAHYELERMVEERTVELAKTNHELTEEVIERKQAEEALRESEERLNLVIKGSNDAPWDWDLISNELYYSPQWWLQLGYTPNELPVDAALWERLMHPEDSDHMDSVFRAALKNGIESYKVEFRLLHKDGHYVPVLSRGLITRDENGKPIRVTGTNMDLSEHKQAEQTATDERNFSNTLIASQPDIFYVLDPTGRFIRWNDKLRDLLGYSDSQIAAADALDIIHEADRPLVAQKTQETFEQGTATNVARLITKMGIRDFSLTATRVETAKGAYAVGIHSPCASGIHAISSLRAVDERR